MSHIYIFMGIQGAGKGTQAARLSESLNIPHISTGDIFRAIIKQDSPLGEELREILNSGALVPDELTSRMVKDRIAQDDAQNGFILDGYPRTDEQANHLNDMLKESDKAVDGVFFFDLPEEESVARLEPRRVCTENNAHIYHLKYNPPREAGKCDIEGAPLKQRDDDKPDAIRKRVSEYIEKTLPILEIYEGQGQVHKINAMQDIDAITDELMGYVK